MLRVVGFRFVGPLVHSRHCDFRRLVPSCGHFVPQFRHKSLFSVGRSFSTEPRKAEPEKSGKTDGEEAIAEDSAEEVSSGEDDFEEHYVEGKGVQLYEAPLTKAVKAIKIFSVSSCTISLIAAPMLVFMANPEISNLARGSMAFTVLAFGLGTTSLMHMFTRPYITAAFYDLDTDMVCLESFTMLAQRKTTYIPFTNIDVNVKRPFTSFLDTATGDHYFIHRTELHQHPMLQQLIAAREEE
mmetsp:Transcript_50759/g.99472  ORF Transcript_50759/g.99472 Transcript_50759/m.99472 type:complete len:241 (+) Transcript_50759:2-724(+)